jgi:tetratricopeptide (TPR) repeat protein
MSSSILTQTLLGSLLDSPAIVEITAKVLGNAVPVLVNHFTLSAEEITHAYQESCRYSFVAISIGLNAPDSFYKKLRYSNLTREFATQIKQNYLQPFSQQHGEPDINLLVKPLIKWTKQTHQLFAIKQITQEDLSALIGYRETFAISEFILSQMQQIETVDDSLATFLTFQELLGNSVLFFFRERLRKDPRVQATQTALQQENLCIELKNIQATVNDLKSTQEKYPFLAEQIAAQIQQLERWQVQHETLLNWQNNFAKQLDEVLDWAEDISINLDQLKEDFAETKEAVVKTYDLAAEINQKLDEILTAQQQNHSAQINHRDGTVQYAPENRELLTAILNQLKQLPSQHPQYGQVSNKLGRVLSSSGALDEAARLFERLIEQSTQKADQALAHFNLFQVRWRQAFTATTVSAKEQLYAQALISLQRALDLDRTYALHDMSEGKGYYPIKKMLGAGGMGCAFLCENHNFKITGHQWVVVKCFWENISDNLEQLFQEPKTMHDIAGEYVPEILDYGYADNVQQTKPYFVSEYIEGAIDGEAWLEKEGCLDLATGLQVAVQIAQALQRAHEQGVCHLDLKPANLLLKKTDEQVAVKVIDFGLARVTTALSQVAEKSIYSGVTVFGQTMFGTLDYAPPEQRGYAYRYGQPSAKSDIFAFGMTMYRLWTGKNPHPFLERNLPDIPALRDLLCDCVAENPAQRPESVYLVKSLTSVIDEQVAAKHPATDKLLENQLVQKPVQPQV